jgi:hypothetical protein
MGRAARETDHRMCVAVFGFVQLCVLWAKMLKNYYRLNSILAYAIR